MPAITQEISETLIRDNINRAVCDVFKTMLHRTTQLEKANVQGEPSVSGNGDASSQPQVVGTVGFLGEINGLIYLYFEGKFAKKCASEMLGMSDAEIDEAGEEVVNDAIGEITNMTVGSFKNGLSDQGFPCKLTIPSILRGRNFSIEPISDSQRFIYHFDCAGQTLIADIILKCGD